MWILLKQETVTGSGISWAVCKSAPCSRQITTPAPHHSVFLQAGCPSCCPTNSVKALKALVTACRKLCKQNWPPLLCYKSHCFKTAIIETISKIRSTEASRHIYTSQWPVKSKHSKLFVDSLYQKSLTLADILKCFENIAGSRFL